MSRLETRIPPPVWAVLVGAAMFGVSRLDLGATAGSTPLGVAIAVVGVAIAASGIWQFARAGTTVDPHAPERASELVDGGVYRITRNPMYLGLAVVLVGWGVLLGEPVVAVVGPLLFVAVITRLQIIPEERILAARFGEDYEAFRSRTRRWI